MRPRVCTRSTTTSIASPRITRAPAGSPRAGRRTGLPVDLELVETNFVQVVSPSSASTSTTRSSACARQGVALSQTKPGILRAVTHLDLTDEDVEHALTAVPAALGAHVRV